ncbi:7225_t:CDS:2 [Paraglomus brasilianum]|uniref:Ribosome assembly factor mrt4 n=1 Tax=Paraglomus brasilianum TaxID=144538 RepID=A0A9N9A3Z2_9GLOM|nr:7225_t:CDS:2 [Paraglomus brasilianum]
MPKSKRAKLVHLTATLKKGKEQKEQLVDTIRKAVDDYKFIWLFHTESSRNGPIKRVRAEWSSSRIFWGKNKVMAIALGTTPESEYQYNLRLISQCLTGEVGLLFTDMPVDKVLSDAKMFTESVYARTGFIATETIVIPEGPVILGDAPIPHSMEPQLRKLGMPTILKDGVVILPVDYAICQKGNELSANQAHLLL